MRRERKWQAVLSQFPRSSLRKALVRGGSGLKDKAFHIEGTGTDTAPHSGDSWESRNSLVCLKCGCMLGLRFRKGCLVAGYKEGKEGCSTLVSSRSPGIKPERYLHFLL